LASSSSSSATCNISSNRKVGPKAFSTAAYVSNSHKFVTGIRPFFATDGGPAIGVTATSSSSIHTNANDAIFGNNCSSSSDSDIIRRSMATSNRKVIDAKNAKRLKIQQKKKKNTNASKVRFDQGVNQCTTFLRFGIIAMGRSDGRNRHELSIARFILSPTSHHSLTGSDPSK
jgi:hypothetical protein